MKLLILNIPRVTNCCFCVSLKTGSLVLGWVGVVLNLIGFIVFVLALNQFETIIDGDLGTSEQLDANLKEVEAAIKGLQKQKSFILISLSVFALMCLLDFITNLLLLVGIYTKRPAFIAQWLISSIMWFLLAVVGQLFRIIAMAEYGYYYSLMYAFTLCFIGFGLRFYWWLSVYSVFVLVKNGKPLDQTWTEVEEHEDDEEKSIVQN